MLNSLGIFTFAQVAAWQKAERDWVDGYLNFKGRIDRDDWVKQADALARGGVDEYIRGLRQEAGVEVKHGGRLKSSAIFQFAGIDVAGVGVIVRVRHCHAA